MKLGKNRSKLSIREKATLRGNRYLIEPIFLDGVLSIYEDGKPRKKQDSINDAEKSGIPEYKYSRAFYQLLNTGLLVEEASNLKITSLGLLHLAKGGYTAQCKTEKRVSFSFWFSIIATSVSILATLIAVFK